ncbi:MAG: hypothetical protein Q8M69_11945, partial [Reyranella sp.]|nr:hypothetical protein [Reyranella sp.]
RWVDLIPLRGRTRRGQPLLAKVPHGSWPSMTFLAPACHDRVEAPRLIEGPINGESGHLSIDRALVPPLRPAPSSRRTNETNEINETTDS